MSRSLLFIPANRARMLEKAEKCNADSIIFDLEDSVPKNEKESARLLLKNFLNTFNKRSKELIIRINSDSDIRNQDMLETIGTNKVDAFMIPKAAAEEVVKVDKFLGGIGNDNISLIPIIETSKSFIFAHKIAESSNKIKGMLFGAEDFATQMNLVRTTLGEEISTARSIFAIICNACEVESYDTPFLNVDDMEGLEFDTIKGKSFGMTGKAAIHPKQIDIINDIYTPSDDKIEEAKLLIKKEKEFSEKGIGSFSFNGEMVDMAVVMRAKKLLSNKGIDIKNL